MSDDHWRRGRDERDDFDDIDEEFGAVRFADDADDDWEASGSSAASFGDDTGSMPAWSAGPTTGQTRAVAADDDDLDVWSSFSDRGGSGRDRDDDPARPEPPRIQIGTDPTDEGARYAGRDPEERPRPARPARPPRAARTGRGRGTGVGGRDMPVAVGMGLALGAAFIAIDAWGPPMLVAVFVSLVMALGAIEFYDKTTERGYQPATVIGIVAIAAAPSAGYNFGERGVLLAVAFAFMATAVSFVGAPGLQSGPLPNVAVTNLGVVYLGVLGAFAGLIVSTSTSGGFPEHLGTDTLMIAAIGVVASDVGALFVGSSFGRTPLRAWISPGKTVEGFIGGLVLCIVAVALATTQSDTWNGPFNALVLGVGIGVLAPLGDLTESMFKRNLDIKDFGTLIKGHGGVLDRFDGFLFALPFTYYAMIALEPWTYVKK